MGCGRRAAKPALARLVVVDGEVVADPEQRLPGRGAYVCPQLGCWQRARARSAFARAFRGHVTVPDDAVNLER